MIKDGTEVMLRTVIRGQRRKGRLVGVKEWETRTWTRSNAEVKVATDVLRGSCVSRSRLGQRRRAGSN